VLYVFLRARESGYAPFLGLTHVLWLFLALLLGITSFLSQDWSFSFFGDTRRGDGLIFVFHVGLYAFLLSWVLQTRQRLELSLMAGLAAGTVTLFFLSLVVGLTAPLELVAWTQTAGSVLGNQNLFAHYVLLLALFNAYFLITKPRPWNVFFLFLLLFAIGVTRSSTGIFLGALLGLVCVLFYSRKLFAGALGLGVGALLLYALNFQIHPFLQKEIASLSVRWDLWRDVLETVLKERPILGFGWGNEALLRSSASQELMSSARFSGFVVFDRAHNFILEFLSAAGIAGVFALFAFWGRVLLSSLGCFRAGRGRIWGFFFLAFSMHLAFLLFNFDGNMSYILSALLLAGYMLLEREESVRLQVPRFIVLPVSIGVVLLSLFAAWEFSVKPLYAYSLVREAHYLLAVADARQDEAPSRLRRAQEILQPYDTILLEAASA
ncbi:MAG: O-antigen ligase family protein, partial [Candidatus Pacearchaeota archaeon]|nr:O-antigen ligase family protein [Candidatus Pacearchaeota archaeon]